MGGRVWCVAAAKPQRATHAAPPDGSLGPRWAAWDGIRPPVAGARRPGPQQAACGGQGPNGRRPWPEGAAVDYWYFVLQNPYLILSMICITVLYMICIAASYMICITAIYTCIVVICDPPLMISIATFCDSIIDFVSLPSMTCITALYDLV